MRGLAAACALLALLIAGCDAEETIRAAGKGPEFVLPAVDGSTVRLVDFRGKVVLLDFWATWCPPCVEMIPVLSRLSRDYGPRGLVVLGISLDDDGLTAVGPFVARERVPYQVLLGTTQVAKAFGGVASIPTVFIVDRDGRLVRKIEGLHTYEQLASEIGRYL